MNCSHCSQENKPTVMCTKYFLNQSINQREICIGHRYIRLVRERQQ